jgi:very-short-patch-repair endonuclease
MLGRHDHSRRLTRFARQNRAQSTTAERKLWAMLREQLPEFRFRRQHPVAGYVVDFVCLNANLVIELDGGQHADAAGVAYDSERTCRLEQVGLRVLRVADDQMLRDPEAVLRTIYLELTERRPSPRPSP